MKMRITEIATWGDNHLQIGLYGSTDTLKSLSSNHKTKPTFYFPKWHILVHLLRKLYVQTTVMILRSGLVKQCRPRSVCSWRSSSSLIWVYTVVCHSVCIVRVHLYMVRPHCSNFRMITAFCLGIQIFRIFTVISITGYIWVRWAVYMSYWRICHSLVPWTS